MKIWLIVDYEPIPGLDGQCRCLRYGIFAETLAAMGHEVTWWTSNFDHSGKRHRVSPAVVVLRKNLTLHMLAGCGYDKNISFERIKHNRSVAQSFTAATRGVSIDDLPDVIVACLHTLELSEAAATFAESQGIPLVIDIVDIWPEVYLRAFPGPLKRLARTCLHYEFARARRIIESAAAITAVSETYLRWAMFQLREVNGRTGT